MPSREYARRKQARRTKPVVLPVAATNEPSDAVRFFPEDGVLLLSQPELFRSGHEAICGRLVEEIAKQDGVRSTRASLELGTCEIAFTTRQVDHTEVSSRIAGAFHLAIVTVALAPRAACNAAG